MDYSFDIQNKSAYYFDNPNLRGSLCSFVIQYCSEYTQSNLAQLGNA